MKKVSIENYIKVLILSVTTILVVLLLANFYTEKRQYERANEDVMGFLDTIKYEELNEYLVENTNGFIYISSSSDVFLDDFELELKNLILSHELEEEFVYIDSVEFSEKIYKDLKDTCFANNLSKETELGRANLFALRNGKIDAILQVNGDVVNLNDILSFINRHEVTE